MDDMLRLQAGGWLAVCPGAFPGMEKDSWLRLLNADLQSKWL
ncbi:MULTISPECIES: hypothetical protein [Comamonas]|jgi:hypothetical protein|nr:MULTISPECIES: hypothetical protein [Comamonas]